MTVLRVSLVVAISAGLVACGGNGNDERDSGRPPTDAPTTPTDAPVVPTDAPGTDGGGTTRSCMGPAGGACDVLAQDCTGTDGCYYARTGEGTEPNTLCAPSGTGADGDACTTVNDCQPGFTCEAGGVCRRYCCDGASSDCELGQICIGVSGAGDIGICNQIDNCTLAPQSGCEAGEGCWIVADDGSTSCFTAGTKTEGQACGPLNDCVAGFGCYGISGAPQECIGFCRLGTAGDCSAGRTCEMLGGLPTGIGLCLEM